MGNPDELVDAVRDKLRAIPGVLALVNDDESLIASYQDDSSSVFEGLNQTVEPSILVVLSEGEFTEEGNAQYVYTVTVYLRLRGQQRLGSAFHAIASGVPNGETEPLHHVEIHGDFELMGLPAFRRDSDEDGVEYPAVVMRFRDRTNG